MYNIISDDNDWKIKENVYSFNKLVINDSHNKITFPGVGAYNV